MSVWQKSLALQFVVLYVCMCVYDKFTNSGFINVDSVLRRCKIA